MRNVKSSRDSSLFREMPDDRRAVVKASNEDEKSPETKEKRRKKRKHRSGRIARAARPPTIDDRPTTTKSRDSLERNFPRIAEVALLDRQRRPQDDNPEAGPESTYSGEPIHHEWNVQEDGRGDKFIPSEVDEDTGIRSQGSIDERDEPDRANDDYNDGDDDGKDGKEDDDGNRRATAAMDKSPKSRQQQQQQQPENESWKIVEASNLSIDEGQVDRSSRDVVKGEVPSDFRGSPELRRNFSRTSNARDDARRLKSATLDRMGKMFKLRSVRDSSKDHAEGATEPEATEDPRGDQQSRKDKTNSLGRMFKLVDKNGEPRKIFPQSRTGSLGHIFRRKSAGAASEDDNSLSSGNNRGGVFARLLNQCKNRSAGGNATVEPNLRRSNAAEDKSSSAKAPSTSRINLSSSRPDPLQVPAAPAAPISPPVNNADVEYPA